MKLKKISNCEFDQIYDILEQNFIPEECRERETARALLANPDFTVYNTVDGDNNVGFVTVWSFEDFDFIEHFVIYEAYRNKGCGARVLELLKSRGKNLVLEAELPGFAKENINIDIEGETLTLTAERGEAKENESDGFVQRERVYGKFVRRFDISNIKEEEITASYKDGILEITLPKKQDEQPKSRKLGIN